MVHTRHIFVILLYLPLAYASGSQPVTLVSLTEQIIEAINQDSIPALTDYVNQNTYPTPEAHAHVALAVRSKKYRCLEILLSKSERFGEHDLLRTGLFYTAEHGDEKSVAIIVAKILEQERASEQRNVHERCEGDVKLIGSEEWFTRRVGAANAAGDRPLHLAAQKGNVSSLKGLLSERVLALFHGKPYVNETNSSGMSALHIAAFHGFGKCVDLLCSLANPNKTMRDASNRTALDCAYEGGHFDQEMCQKLIDKSAFEKAGKSFPHHFAAEGSEKALARWLSRVTRPSVNRLDPVAVLNERNSLGQTLLEVACSHGQPTCVERLLRIYGKDYNGEVAKVFRESLLGAVAADSVACAEKLFEKDATLVTQVPTLFGEAAPSTRSAMVSDSMLAFFQSKGIQTQLFNRRSALLDFAREAQEDLPGKVTELLKNGAVANAADASGKTALHYFVEKGFVSCVNEFITNNKVKREDLEVEDNSLCTPLHYAARASNLACIRELCRARVSCDTVTSSGKIPLELIPEYETVPDELLDSSEDEATGVNSELSEGIKCLYFLFRHMVETRMEKNSEVADGKICLHYAAELLNPEFVNIFVRINNDAGRYAKLMYFKKDDNEMTALHLLAKKFPHEVAYAIRNVRKEKTSLTFPNVRAELVYDRFMIFYRKWTKTKTELIEDLRDKVPTLPL